MRSILVLLTATVARAAIAADPIQVTVHAIDDQGVGQPIGTLALSDSRFGGLLIRPDVSRLSPGLHGFHVHENADCGPALKDGRPSAGGAAGGHFDPQRTGRHEGPYGNGHTGDLPALLVDESGRAVLPLLAPRLTLADLRGRALVVHAGADNYADRPQSLGGGGGRVACAVVPGKAGP